MNLKFILARRHTHIKYNIKLLWIIIILITIFGVENKQNKEEKNYLLLGKDLYWQSNEPIGGVEESDFKIAIIKTEYQEPKIDKFIYPVYNARYTQRYSLIHRGIDLVNKEYNNDSILAVSGGKVILNEWIGGYGNRIEIDNGRGIITSYSHLKLSLVRIEDEILKGQKIGIMGSTGNSTGNHLHFEVIINGIKVNPEKFLINL